MYSILRRREIQDKVANTEPKHIFWRLWVQRGKHIHTQIQINIRSVSTCFGS